MKSRLMSAWVIVAVCVALIISGVVFLKPFSPYAGESKRILLGESSQYANLSAEGKGILESYSSNLKAATAAQLSSQGLDPLTYADDSPTSAADCSLKYYDSEKALISCAGFYHPTNFSLYARGSWEQIPNSCGISGTTDEYQESSEYIVSLSDAGVCYYKAGDVVATLVSGSALSRENGDPLSEETYVKEDLDMGIPVYEFTFDPATKTLSASIFKRASVGEAHQKIRTATFLLTENP